MKNILLLVIFSFCLNDVSAQMSRSDSSKVISFWTNFLQVVESRDKNAQLELMSDSIWCGPCREVEEDVERMSGVEAIQAKYTPIPSQLFVDKYAPKLFTDNLLHDMKYKRPIATMFFSLFCIVYTFGSDPEASVNLIFTIHKINDSKLVWSGHTTSP